MNILVKQPSLVSRRGGPEEKQGSSAVTEHPANKANPTASAK